LEILAVLDAPDPCNPACPSRKVLELIGSKWAILLMCQLQRGPVRTGELMRSVGGISQKMLTQSLRELQQRGLIERVSYNEVPPRVDYRLTPLGVSLSGLLRAMEQWVIANYPAIRAYEEQSGTLTTDDDAFWLG
jgi:DNA-binding HxlR family transcriptional regulator